MQPGLIARTIYCVGRLLVAAYLVLFAGRLLGNCLTYLVSISGLFV